MNRRLSPHSRSFQLATFAVLAAVMLVTRTHSLSNLVHLPETSLASFFVLGYLVRQPLGFAALFLLAFGIDVVTINVLVARGIATRRRMRCWFRPMASCGSPAVSPPRALVSG
jgi:hypothetical protein